MSDDEILEHMYTDDVKPLSEERGIELYAEGIFQNTKDTVVKIDGEVTDGTSAEILTLDFVARYTTIPVPRVRCVLPMTSKKFAIVMDYIPGGQLVHVWPKMSFFAKLRVAFILRGYVRQLRAIQHPRSRVPGPIAPGDEARDVLCPMITGPDATPR